MAYALTPSRQSDSTSDVLQKKGFQLTVFSDRHRHSYEKIYKQQKHFHKLFIASPPVARKLQFNSTSVFNHCLNSPLRISLIQVSSMIYSDFDNCKDSGWIACNSLLSRLYAKGITECDTIMMNLAISLAIKSGIRKKVVEEIVAGFKDCADEAKAKVTNGHFIVGPHVMMGGVATTIRHINDVMPLDEAVSGDTLVLTKPLGAFLAARFYNDEFKFPAECNEDASFLSNVDEAYKTARLSMRRSNKIAAILMKKYNAHAVIDLNECSLLDSARELVLLQKKCLEFQINMLPLIEHSDKIDEYFNTGLILGNSPELSGGLLISLPCMCAQRFIREIEEAEGFPCFLIGLVNIGPRTAIITEVPRLLPVNSSLKSTQNLGVIK